MTAPLKSKRNTTHLRVSFFTHDPLNNRIDDFSPLPGSAPNSSLVSLSYSRRLSEPAGSITITMKARKLAQDAMGRGGKLWTDLIKVGDWWLVEVDKSGQGRHVMACGVIDAVNYSVGQVNGAPVATCTVQGRDFGFALQDTPVFFNPYDEAVDNTLGVNMMTVIDQAAGDPATTVRSIIRGLTGVALVPNGSTQLPPGILWGVHEVPKGIAIRGGTPWGLVLDTRSVLEGGRVQDPFLRGAVLLTNLLTPDTGAGLWDLVQSWCNRVMNEVFIDTSPTLSPLGLPQPKLVVREKPFENLIAGPASQWFGLPTWEVDARLCSEINLTTGQNRVNYIVLTGDLKPVLQDTSLIGYPPAINLQSCRRYGIKRLEESTIYDSGEALQVLPQLPFAGAYRQWLFNLISWNLMNHEHWQGSITTPELRAEIKIGERVSLRNAALANLPGFPDFLKLAGQDLTFYVEGIDLTWMAGGSPKASTTVTVSRGYPDDLRLAKMAEEARNWSLQTAVPSGSANQGTSVAITTVIEQFLLAKAGLPEPPVDKVVE